jgi:hypothetical protein
VSDQHNQQVCESCASGACHWPARQLGEPCTCHDHDRSVAARQTRTNDTRGSEQPS